MRLLTRWRSIETKGDGGGRKKSGDLEAGEQRKPFFAPACQRVLVSQCTFEAECLDTSDVIYFVLFNACTVTVKLSEQR